MSADSRSEVTFPRIPTESPFQPLPPDNGPTKMPLFTPNIKNTPEGPMVDAVRDFRKDESLSVRGRLEALSQVLPKKEADKIDNLMLEALNADAPLEDVSARINNLGDDVQKEYAAALYSERAPWRNWRREGQKSANPQLMEQRAQGIFDEVRLGVFGKVKNGSVPAR